MVNTPKSQHRLRIHQFTDLLSRNFKKLSTQSISLTKNKGTMDSPSKRSLESSKIMTETTFPIPFPIDFQEDLISGSSMIVEEQAMEGIQNVRPEAESSLYPLIPQATMNEIYVPSPTNSEPKNIYDDLMARLCNDDDILKLEENNEQIPLDDISLEVLKAVEGLAHSVTNDRNSTTLLTSNSLEEVNISIPPAAGVVVSEAFTQFQSPSFPVHPYGCTSVGASASASVGGIGCTSTVNASVVAGASTTVRLATTDPQDPPQIGTSTVNASVVAGASTTVRLATTDPQDPPQIGTSFGNSVFPNTTGNPLTQFQSCSSKSSFPMLPYDSSSNSSYQQFPRYIPYLMTGIGPQGIPAMMPQHNQGKFWLRPPPLSDFPNFVHAWEGSLVERIHLNDDSLTQARVVRKPTSPVTLTAEWGPRLEIVLFLPTNAVNYTMKILGGPIDYVFFHITHFNHLNLYDRLKSKNLCAKIELPPQTIILSTTSSKYHFLGAIFPGDTLFVEPA
ncbi:hypothetical protein AAZX31_02G133200 [Glycine max]|nr:Mediator of RNA polymerase II transcription subunit 25 [Glycine max]